MRKNKKAIVLLIVVLIISLAIPLRVYAEDKELKDYGATEIKKHITDNGVSGLDDDTLVAWYDTINKKLDEVEGTKNEDTYQKIMNKISKEMDNRRVSSSTEFLDEDFIKDIDYWNPNQGSSGNNELIKLTEQIVGIIQVIGSIASVMALVIMGTKYMFASVDEKAKYKEEMIPYIVGCVLLFAIVNIASAAYRFGSKLTY